MTTTITVPTITSKQFEMEVKEGLIYILNHLDGLWPRMISTYATGGGQRLVNNFTEAIAWFKAVNFLDCRISAYPKYTNDYIDRTGIASTVLLADLDREHFETTELFELAATKTYTNFHTILGSRPTQLWTGGGRHFIQPQSVPVLERIEDFQKFDQPSRRFMQFEERLLTDDHGDKNHWSTVSFNNMMLRVPCSLNSSCIQFDGCKIVNIPYDARVRIERYWDGHIPTVEKILLMRYYNWLQFSRINDIKEQKAREKQFKCYGRAKGCRSIYNNNNHDYDYIEKLVDKPIGDYRNYCVWRILVPYYINIKGLSRSQTFDIVKTWLDRCNSKSRLDFAPKQKLDYELDHVGKFTPIRQYQLKEGHLILYALLEKEGLIS